MCILGSQYPISYIIQRPFKVNSQFSVCKINIDDYQMSLSFRNFILKICGLVYIKSTF